MGPQNASRDDRQLYDGNNAGQGGYSPSDRASSGVSAAMGSGGHVDGKSVGAKESDTTASTPTQEKKPTQPVGGNPPSPKQQESARYSEPGGSNIADQKA